jgi:hypothetical protein
VKRSLELWAGCIAGALHEDEYAAKLRAAGFEDVGVEPTRVYGVEDVRSVLAGSGPEIEAMAEGMSGTLMSAFVRAVKRSGS